MISQKFNVKTGSLTRKPCSVQETFTTWKGKLRIPLLKTELRGKGYFLLALPLRVEDHDVATGTQKYRYDR